MKEKDMGLPNSSNYDAIVAGACNLEVCVEDCALAERLLRKYPNRRKLYPEIKQVGDNYVVCPSDQFRQDDLREITGGKDELLIAGGSVKKCLAAGGGANASKVLAKFRGRVLLMTSIGGKGDPNYKTMCGSLKQYPQVEFLDLPGRPSVGVTLNVYGGGKQSSLLICRGRGTWGQEEFERELKRKVKHPDLQRLPVMAIALSPDYLPLLQSIVEEKGKIEYFCPSRGHINILRSRTEDRKHFERALFVQANIEEIGDIYNHLYGDGKTSTMEDEHVARIMRRYLKDWRNNIIATRNERGAYLLKAEESEIMSFSACRKLPGEFVDDTGAGDAFAGAFFWYHFLNGKEVERSIEFATTFAAYTITDAGAIGRLPKEREVENWMGKYGPNVGVKNP